MTSDHTVLAATGIMLIEDARPFCLRFGVCQAGDESGPGAVGYGEDHAAGVAAVAGLDGAVGTRAGLVVSPMRVPGFTSVERCGAQVVEDQRISADICRSRRLLQAAGRTGLDAQDERSPCVGRVRKYRTWTMLLGVPHHDHIVGLACLHAVAFRC
jgi:hypothetical protein